MMPDDRAHEVRAAEWESKFQGCIARARYYLSDPAGRGQAVLAMSEASNLAREVRHWADLAKCWARDFDDRVNAINCIRLAHDLAEGEADVGTLAYHIRDIDEQGEVTRQVLGYRMVPSDVFFAITQAGVWEALGEHEPAVDSMAEAERKAVTVRSSLRETGQFDEKALQYFDVSTSFRCWLFVGECWVNEFRDREQAVRCAVKAEDIATDLSSWVGLVQFWMKPMGEPEQGRRCMTEDEKRINRISAFDYALLAEGAAALGDPNLPVQYLDKAESLIDEISDWSAICYTWEELGYWDRADRAWAISDYLHEKIDMDDYMVNGGYGRYVPGEGPY